MALASDINGRPLTRRNSLEVREPPGVNKNTNWLDSAGAWAFYVGLIAILWLVLSLFVEGGLAFTYVLVIHGLISFYLLHWVKGSPIDADQGKYDKLTFWEQLDDGVQYTATRKFFTAIPVLLFFLALNGTEFKRQPLGLNLIVTIVLVVAKMPALHKVRIFGINKH